MVLPSDTWKKALGAGEWSVGRLSAEADRLGQRIVLVGGAVRDHLLGLPIGDLDLAVEGDAIRLARAVVQKYGGDIRIQADFGTAKWMPKSDDSPGKCGVGIDLASARRETYAAPAALPKVSAATLEEDLARRDFSCNAMAVSMNAGSFGELIDPFGGRADLEAGVIRALHRTSFDDDPTRMWRAARFAGRYGFQVESETQQWIADAQLRGSLAALGLERLGQEVGRLLEEPRALEELRVAQRLGLTRNICKALDHRQKWLGLVEKAQLAWSEHGQGLVSQADVLWLAVALSIPLDRRKAMVRMIPGGKQLQSRWIDGPEALCQSMKGLGRLKRRSSVGRRLERLDLVSVVAGFSMVSGPRARDWLAWWIGEGRHIETVVDGTALIQEGVEVGPRIGCGITAGLAASRDGGGAEEQWKAAIHSARPLQES